MSALASTPRRPVPRAGAARADRRHGRPGTYPLRRLRGWLDVTRSTVQPPRDGLAEDVRGHRTDHRTRGSTTMTTTPQPMTEPETSSYARRATEHLWMHFTRHSTYEQ